MALDELTASEAARRMARGALSSEELVGACLARIAERERTVRAWAFVNADLALRQARARDRAREPRGLLHGIPVGIKDVIDTADMPTAYNSPIYRGHVPKRDAECVVRLRAAGAVILGKTKTSEFAHLTPTDTRNPHDPKRTPGGSSSGSAAAVADVMVPLALGTQTGGSTIRPASYCGAFAFKPSYRRISTRGIKSVAASFDTVGLVARSVDDLIVLDRVLAEVPGPAAKPDRRRPRIGYCETPFWTQAEPATRRALRAAAAALGDGGATVEAVKLSGDFAAINDGFYRVSAVEIAWSLDREYREHRRLLSPRLRAFIAKGKAMEPDDVQRVRAAQIRSAIEVDRLFDRFDALLTPSAPGEAGPGNAIGDNVFNRAWTMMHLPCLTIPSARGPNGMPVGIQLVGRRGGDGALLALGRRAAAILLG